MLKLQARAVVIQRLVCLCLLCLLAPAFPQVSDTQSLVARIGVSDQQLFVVNGGTRWHRIITLTLVNEKAVAITDIHVTLKLALPVGASIELEAIASSRGQPGCKMVKTDSAMVMVTCLNIAPGDAETATLSAENGCDAVQMSVRSPVYSTDETYTFGPPK